MLGEVGNEEADKDDTKEPSSAHAHARQRAMLAKVDSHGDGQIEEAGRSQLLAAVVEHGSKHPCYPARLTIETSDSPPNLDPLVESK